MPIPQFIRASADGRARKTAGQPGVTHRLADVRREDVALPVVMETPRATEARRRLRSLDGALVGLAVANALLLLLLLLLYGGASGNGAAFATYVWLLPHVFVAGALVTLSIRLESASEQQVLCARVVAGLQALALLSNGIFAWRAYDWYIECPGGGSAAREAACADQKGYLLFNLFVGGLAVVLALVTLLFALTAAKWTRVLASESEAVAAYAYRRALSPTANGPWRPPAPDSQPVVVNVYPDAEGETRAEEDAPPAQDARATFASSVGRDIWG